MKLPKFLKLKVYQNKTTKQRTIVLPARDIKLMRKKLPKEVKVSW
jgi:hypothetical protein